MEAIFGEARPGFAFVGDDLLQALDASHDGQQLDPEHRCFVILNAPVEVTALGGDSNGVAP